MKKDNKIIVDDVDVREFKYYKLFKQKEQDYETLANQYNAVVEQNKQLQTELNNCKKLLDDFIKAQCKQFLEETQNTGRCVEIKMNIDDKEDIKQ